MALPLESESIMKPDLHPTMYPKAKTTCTACGAVFLIPGTKEEITIEICSQCHPVYTGKFRGVVSRGRVERFQKKGWVVYKFNVG